MRDNDNMAYPLSPADTESDTSSNADPWSPAPSTPSSTGSSDDLPPSPDSSPAPSPHPAYYHRDGPAYHQHRGHAHGRWDDSKRESLLSAVRRGDCAELGLLLRGEDVNVNVIDGHGQTPLHQGCMDGNLEMVKLLVHHGADVRLANRDGWSPLHLATFCGNYEIVTYLVGNMNSRAS